MDPKIEQEYRTYFNRFHNDRLEALSEDDKVLKCKGCPQEKMFWQSETSLIYSCGSLRDKPCATQFEVILPEYLDYLKTRALLTRGIPYNDDIQDLSPYDLKRLHEATDLSISSEVTEQAEEMKESL